MGGRVVHFVRERRLRAVHSLRQRARPACSSAAGSSTSSATSRTSCSPGSTSSSPTTSATDSRWSGAASGWRSGCRPPQRSLPHRAARGHPLRQPLCAIPGQSQPRSDAATPCRWPSSFAAPISSCRRTASGFEHGSLTSLVREWGFRHALHAAAVREPADRGQPHRSGAAGRVRAAVRARAHSIAIEAGAAVRARACCKSSFRRRFLRARISPRWQAP